MKETGPRSTKFTSNGHGEGDPLSPRAVQRFDAIVTTSPVPDIDTAQQILPTARNLYVKLGLPPETGKKLAATLEQNLFGGTANQQAYASQALISLDRACQNLPDINNSGNKR